MQAEKQRTSSVIDKIKSSDEATIGGLITLYNLQTTDEQIARATAHQNSLGFNAYDAGIMSDMVKFYQAKGYLSDKQIAFIRRTILKYKNQLEQYGLAEIKTLQKPTAPEIKKTKLVSLQDKTLIIKFQFPKGDVGFSETLNNIKTLSGRSFDATNKIWTAPISAETIQSLIEWGFEIDKAALDWHQNLTAPVQVDDQKYDFDPRLFPYQKEGVAFIDSRNGNALIGDEMGLGKTCQALTYLQLHPEKRPVLIVCPASLKLNWAKEIDMWVKDNKSIHMIYGKKSSSLPKADFYIINYDIIGDANKKSRSGWVSVLEKMNFQQIIIDECHKIKSRTTKRSRALIYLSGKISSKIAISGTPIVNRAIEFYNPIKFVNDSLYPSFWKFAEKFTYARHNGFGWEFKGVKNADVLYKHLTDTIMIRRLKEDVLKDLPAKTRAIIPLEIDNRNRYLSAENDIISFIRNEQGAGKAQKAKMAEVLVKIEKLKQLAVEGIFDQATEWIENFLESDKKLIVFATHKSTINRLMEHYPGLSVKIDGSTSKQMRQEAIDRFQNDDSVRLFIGNVQAAGVGITLTAASDVLFLELPWTPGEVTQAEDRAHRIGQKDNVTCWYLMAKGTVMEDMVSLINEKIKVLDQVLDGKDPDEESIFDSLIESLKGN